MFARRLFSSVMTILLFVGLSGCSGGESDEVVTPSVDPRYATPQAVVNEFNGFTTRTPVDYDGFFSLIYAENEIQRRIVSVMSMGLRFDRFMRDFEARYNEPWTPGGKKMDEGPNQPARVTLDEGQRATAEYVGDDGKAQKLMLVKIGERWWISGFTLEYDPEFRAKVKPEQLPALEEMLRGVSSVIQGLAQRMNAGEFAAAIDLRKAFGVALMEYATLHPREVKEFGSYTGLDGK
jgi:hypothetical protein